MRAMARPIRIAAAGDIHCSPESRERAEKAFAGVDDVDLILLAGDLTTHGEPEQAEVLAGIARSAKPRVVAVLGNHDWHANRVDELLPLLEEAGVTMLDPGWTTCEVDGVSVGIAGTKGFVGGFPDSQLPDFGEPILREVYRETTMEVEAIEAGVGAVANCGHPDGPLHYPPPATTPPGGPRLVLALPRPHPPGPAL